jgi:phosphatidylglycerol:prolipoprotein diacylglycerol transferase
MYPKLIHLETSLGLVQINSYSFFLWIAILVVTLGFYQRCRVHNLSLRKSFIISVGMISIAVMGARLFHIASNISLYQKYPIQIFAFDANGFSLYGAILLVGIGGFLAARITSFPLWKVSDKMVPYIGISISIARIGCFLNGCCFGKVSNLPWAVRFPIFSNAHLYQISTGQTNLMISLPVHPTQLYEALGALIAVLLAMWVHKKKKVDGSGILVFVASFSVVRLIIHYVRVFPDSFVGIAPLFPALYVGILFFCLFLLFQKLSHQR